MYANKFCDAGQVPIFRYFEAWTIQEPSFLDGSSSFLQVTRPTIKAGISLNFIKIPSLTSEVAALECLINHRIML